MRCRTRVVPLLFLYMLILLTFDYVSVEARDYPDIHAGMHDDKKINREERRVKLMDTMVRKEEFLRLHKEGIERLPPEEEERLTGLVQKIKDKLKKMDEDDKRREEDEIGNRGRYYDEF